MVSPQPFPKALPRSEQLRIWAARIEATFPEAGRAGSPVGSPASRHEQGESSVPSYFSRVAPNLLVLAVARPRIGWSTRLCYALTAACLVDLVVEGRLACDDDGLLVLRDRTLTGSRGHTLVITRIAASGAEWLPSLWIVKLAPEVSRALLSDATYRGVVLPRTRSWGLLSRTVHDVADLARVAELGRNLQHVYEGSSTDPRATALLAICAAAALPQLLPNRPRLKALRRRAQQLPPSPVVDGLSDAVGVLAVPAAALGG